LIKRSISKKEEEVKNRAYSFRSHLLPLFICFKKGGKTTMKLFEMMVNHKINQIKPDELLALAAQYQVSLTQQEAVGITRLLAGQNINIFDPRQRQTVIGRIAGITGMNKAKQIENIFYQLTGSY